MLNQKQPNQENQETQELKKVSIIGAGLAGCEAAWQLAKRQVHVKLYEMRPQKSTAAHKTDLFAELVCSNSLRADNIENAVGLLKKEMQELDSLIIRAANATKVPAGGALAVDRESFSSYITKVLKEHPFVEFINKEITDLNEVDLPVIIATGPLTSEGLSQQIKKIVNQDYLYFYDAAAPLVSYDSINKEKAFLASRYDKGEAAYINCPMNEEEYKNFYNELNNAQKVELKSFEKTTFFEGCMPIEEMARRGEDTMRFGPLKPVGLVDPKTGKEAYAVVQLRQDNAAASIYNMVGFQTHLKFSEQKRVFSMIPGLEKAEFLRYGVMHRNTFINSPKILDNTFCLKGNEKIFFAGQITGVEGYVESAASGLVAGINTYMLIQGKDKFVFDKKTAIGALANYISNSEIDNFQPMNVNFGLFPALDFKVKKKDKKMAFANRAMTIIVENRDFLL